ncbi:5'-flap endonuclease [Parahypoxylon ruwenzoriense]
MSAAEVFASSPPKRESYTLSSSPSFPSPNEIFAAKAPKKPPLRSGNHAIPIPNNARTTFTSAAEVLREAPEIDIETEKMDVSPPRRSKPSKSRKKKTSAPETVSVPIEMSMETPILIESSPDTKPWERFKSKEQVPQSEQPSTSKARVTKVASKGKTGEKTETVSKHFAAKESIAKNAGERPPKGRTTSKPEDQPTSGPSRPEPTLRRRDNWTPPPADIPIVLGSESDDRELPSSVDKRTSSKDVFKILLSQYGCKDVSSSTAPEQPQQTDILKKRKPIECISISNEADLRLRETAPSKSVNTKKKTRTITELATAPYMLSIETELDFAGPATKESLLSYFDTDGAVTALVEHQSAVMSQKKGKAKESKAATKPKRKKKSGTVENPILLSPSSAMKQSSNQDFVFGTSSQLVGEESPTTLRDLQLAIQVSNRIDSDPFCEPDNQGLWHAGARDTDGDLIGVDGIDVVDGSYTLPRPHESIHEEFVDIDDILKSSEMDESAPTLIPPQNSHPLPPPHSHPQPTTSTQPLRTGGHGPPEPIPAVDSNNTQPDYDLLTDAQLSRQIASYGFKPVKKRQAMIALLDQCWTNKNSGASIIQAKLISTTPAMELPKRKQPAAEEPENPPKRRGRPRKNPATEASSTTKTSKSKGASPTRSRGRTKKAASKAIEIADSDLDESLSSRASSPDRIFSSPPPVDLSLSEDADMSLTLSPTDQQSDLFRYITKAVTSAPRSQDPTRPSWHEKMLLYDPIVLEDLAAWLNGGELSRVAYDGEVSPGDVKRWCESKSVICLWRQNLRGKERKRY